MGFFRGALSLVMFVVVVHESANGRLCCKTILPVRAHKIDSRHVRSWRKQTLHINPILHDIRRRLPRLLQDWQGNASCCAGTALTSCITISSGRRVQAT
jgi:hypothetical protein